MLACDRAARDIADRYGPPWRWFGETDDSVPDSCVFLAFTTQVLSSGRQASERGPEVSAGGGGKSA